jgi:cytochrome c-type biogenesis protein CcmH/NrfG
MMNNWLLWCLLAGLSWLSLLGMLYPLHITRRQSVVWAILLLCLIGLSEWQWGALAAWSRYIEYQEKETRVRAMMKTLQGADDLIDRLKASVKQHPKRARGWYLLGRLYASQNRFQDAYDAFARAQQLQPNDVQIIINKVYMVWQLQNQQLDEVSLQLLHQVLQQDSNQPDALSLLAMNAYRRHQYQQAIEYWQHLLTLAPIQSDAARAIQKAIAKAQDRLVKPSDSTHSYSLPQ